MLDAEELLAVVEGTVGEDDALVVLGEGLGPAGGVVDDAPRELLLAEQLPGEPPVVDHGGVVGADHEPRHRPEGGHVLADELLHAAAGQEGQGAEHRHARRPRGEQRRLLQAGDDPLEEEDQGEGQENVRHC